MATIRRFPFVRHLRAESSSFVLRFRRGTLAQSGRALAFWFLPLSTSVAEVPVDDQELTVLFHARTADFQDVSVQGTVTYRVRDPVALAERVDFSVDLVLGRWLKQPLEVLAQRVTLLAQQVAIAWIGQQPLRAVLADGPSSLRGLVEHGLEAHGDLGDLGVVVSSVKIAAVKPTAELEKALEAPMREHIQQESDEATFARRALAVEKERAIQDNELLNQIELAKREEALIAQRGLNEQRTRREQAEAARIEAESEMARRGLEARTNADVLRVQAEAEAEREERQARVRAEGLRLIEGAKVEGEKARMEVYRELPQHVLLGLAAQELAGKLQKIEHVRVEPDTLAHLVDGLARIRGAV